MRNYYLVLKVIKDFLESDPLVTTIVNIDTEDFDDEKQNIYPIVDVQCEDAPLSLSSIDFTFQITALDIRDISKKTSTSKWVGNDNKHDNLNTTLAIVNRLYKSIKKMGEEFTIVNDPVAVPIVYKNKNLLDGFQISLVIRTPNTETEIC